MISGEMDVFVASERNSGETEEDIFCLELARYYTFSLMVNNSHFF